MHIKILKIVDKGNHEKERVVFEVIADEDVGRYIVFKTKKKGENQFDARPSLVYWFPDTEVKKGDLVILYTKVGLKKTTQNKSGNASHFFYWGKAEPIWSQQDDAIILIHSDRWDFK